MTGREYVGRFAPSPTGAMHLGSLVAAVASFVDARAAGGLWRLRIDDLDTPRVVPGCDQLIFKTLENFGLRWDGPVMYQSARRVSHQQAIDGLRAQAAAYICGCSRAETRGGPMGLEGPIYPGTCRTLELVDGPGRAVRTRVPEQSLTISDRVLGRYQQNLAEDVGDFIIRRRDGIASYQLATVVDDAAQGVTDVVRGADLLLSTPRQAWLRRMLGMPAVTTAHTPLLVTPVGEKLGKSTSAPPVSSHDPGEQIWDCLWLLGQRPPDHLRQSRPDAVLAWSIDNWTPERIPDRSVVLPAK